MTDTALQFPTEQISLPSKGWFYAPDSPLATGEVELKYMTAREEDILTSRNLIMKGVVIDRLIEALIIDKTIKYDELLIGDKNALMVASRILGYGKNYPISIDCPACEAKIEVNVNLEDIEDKETLMIPENKGRNSFTFTLPHSKVVIEYKLLTHGDEKAINAEIEAMRKFNNGVTREVTTRIKRSLLSVNGDRDPSLIAKFVDNMLSKDSSAFREYVKTVNPDIDLTTDFMCTQCNHESRVEVPIDVTFFWPSARV